MIDYSNQSYTEDAWNEFFNRFDAFIHRRVASTLRKYRLPYAHHELSDFVQQIYERLIENDFRALRNFRGQTDQAWRAYLSRICDNLVADGYRTQAHASFVECEPLSETEAWWHTYGPSIAEPNQERALQRREIRHLVEVILCRIGNGEQAERDRLVFILRHYQDCSAEEIAQRLQITVNYVNTIYCRVKKHLVLKLSEVLRQGTGRPRVPAVRSVKPQRRRGAERL